MKKCWCGNEQLRPYSAHYSRCDSCNTLITDQEPTDQLYDVKNDDEDFYGHNYWEKTMLEKSQRNSLDELVLQYFKDRVFHWVKHILKYMPVDSNVAEVGCGLGQLAYVMKLLGYRQTAYELSESICEYIQKTLGVNIVCGEFNGTSGTYDGILAMDVFEHLHEPVAFLKNLYASTTEDGILCLQMPRYDETLDYTQLMQTTPRWDALLIPEQHIFLYSKSAITKILAECGFPYVSFEPAIFGDDYDMFLFASKQPLHPKTDDEVDEILRATDFGTMAKVIMELQEEKQYITNRFYKSELDSTQRLEAIDALTAQLKESEGDRAMRMESVKSLTAQLKESEADRAARMESVKSLTAQLKESEADRAARMESIESLSAQLSVCEADRAARLESILTLTALLEESEIDRANRLESIQTLTEQLLARDAKR